MSDRSSTPETCSEAPLNGSNRRSDPFNLADFVLDMNDGPPKRAPREFRVSIKRPQLTKKSVEVTSQSSDEPGDGMAPSEHSSTTIATSDQAISSFPSRNSFLSSTHAFSDALGSRQEATTITTRLSGFLTGSSDMASRERQQQSRGDLFYANLVSAPLAPALRHDDMSIGLRHPQITNRSSDSDMYYSWLGRPAAEPDVFTSDMAKVLKNSTGWSAWQNIEPDRNRQVKNYWD